ncbi:ester cyclase [Planotetraspora kaengkrachanensis]|uniref:ester cyclase n=1 Tax=Planotetraspora kaengkrachanensis TaxID=575193 RepID=UPI001EF18374
MSRFFAACNAHDPDRLAQCFAPHVAAVGPDGEAEGREEVVSYYEVIWTAAPDMRFTVWQTITEGDEIATTALATGTHNGPLLMPGGDSAPGTGRRIGLRCCWVFTVEQDLIASYHLFYDQLEMYAQLGLSMPVVGPPP